MRWATPPTAIRDGDTMPGVRWFPGATLNYAEQALAPGTYRPGRHRRRRRQPDTRHDRADVGPLALGVRRCAAALRQLGVGAGDRVVAYAPNIPETLVAFLATASLGAIWSSCAPEFGVRSVIDRFAQIEPVVLVAVDGYRYGAKDIDRRDHVADIVAALPTLRHVVHVPYLDRHRHPPPAPARAGAPRLGRPAPRRPGRAAVVHAGRRRPPAVRAVQLRHDGTAQGDRPRPRRRRRRAPQGAHVPSGPDARPTASSGSRRPAG